MNDQQIKGGVIVIGSLGWEDEINAIQEDEQIKLGQKRRLWRETVLDLGNIKTIVVPIRYGRSSKTRKCTYTMVFSSTALTHKATGLIIPYNNNIDFADYSNFKDQALRLAEVEGIKKSKDKLIKNWGCIGVYINPTSIHGNLIRDHWRDLKRLNADYAQMNSTSYCFTGLENEYSLLNEDFTLRTNVKVETKLDFLFFIYIKPEHRNKGDQRYPTPEEIGNEIIGSGYKTYFEKNNDYGITTDDDVTIKQIINNKNIVSKKLRSYDWFGKSDKMGFVHRSWLRNQGYPDDYFKGKPVIGICNTWSELTPCNGHLRDFAEIVKRGVVEAGGFPLEFPVTSLGETIMRPTTMLFRNLASMDVEESIRANPIDGVVLLTGCDKTTPSTVMGACSVDLPTIVVPGGPMLNGRFKGECIGSGSFNWMVKEKDIG